MKIRTNAPPTPPVFLPRRQYAGQTDYVPRYSEQETQEFLEDVSDLYDSIKLWNDKSGIFGLLTSELRPSLRQQHIKIRGDAPFVGNVRTITQNARPRAEVFFDFASGRWRYLKSGRLVPISRVRLGVLRVAKAQELAIRRLSAQLVNGEISQAQWYNGMRKLIKDQYRAAWIASIGGIENYNRSEVSKFGWAVRPQYRWLDNFLNELQTGKQPLNGRVALRAAMYARAGNGMYQNNLRKIAEQNGFTEARRILGENESHCNDSGSHEGCIEQAALGWQPIGQVLEIGSATCLSNCLCQMEFR